jgi:hypothetical protein
LLRRVGNMKASLALLATLLLSGCVHRLVVAYESEEAALMGGQIVIGAPKSGAVVQPVLPEVQHESSLSEENRGLFAPGRAPL